MEKRQLGRTGHKSTVVIFGTAAFWSLGQEEANAALDLALQYGINHIDVAPQYGLAEERFGPWLEPHRDQFFVGCKTLERERAGAWADLQRSLQRLRLKSFDLYQLHAVGTFEELDKAFAPGGAMETLKEARDKGLTRYLGITGHGLQTPAVHLAALERFDFDTVMFPIHPTLYANPDYRRDAERLLKVAAERNVGVMIIKSITKGPWGNRDKKYNTWYEPYDQAAAIEQSVHFALSQPITAIPSAADVHLLPMIFQAAERFKPMDAATQAKLIAEAAALEPLFT
jgi:aryl-alcohol dehydrogenase-like predicted oxidoreductase